MILFSFPHYDASYICCLEFWSFFNAKLVSPKRDNGWFLYNNFNICNFMYFFSSCFKIFVKIIVKLFHVYVVHWTQGHCGWWTKSLEKEKRSWAQWSLWVLSSSVYFMILWLCWDPGTPWEKHEKLILKNFRWSRFPLSVSLCEGIKKKGKRIYLMFE